MDHRELDYIDMRDPQARSEYINNAPQPQPGEPLPEERQQVLVVPMPPRAPRGRPRKPQSQRSETLEYVKVGVNQKTHLTALYAQHGDSQTLDWYSSQCRIPLANTKTLLWKLRRGESILPKNHYKRKSRVIPFQHLVLRRLEIDSTTPLRTVRKDLVRVVERFGEDVANIPADVINQIVAEDERRRQEAPMQEAAADQSETEEEGSETVDVDQGEGPTVPSITSLSRFLRGITGSTEGRNIPVISFKRCHARRPAANTDQNKTRRIEAITQLRDKFGAGYSWVCIDETSWRVGNTTAYGWSKRGDPCFVTKARGGIALTSIAAIDNNGVSYCNITTTTNTTETFSAYFRHLIGKYDRAGRPCVFWVDNCRIHNEMRRIVEGTRHCVVFNAAYSPELHPIENIFSIWKTYAERDLREWTNLQDLLNKIAAAFMRIEAHHVAAAMEKCRTDVWMKVVERRDL